MRVVSWNINSVRLRLPLLQHFTESQQPDIICLQETKVNNDKFPLKKLEESGYPHIAFHGEPGYNGVAILSRIPFTESLTLNIANGNDTRHIGITLDNGIELHNFYVPAGGDEPDVNINPKYRYKLAFLEAMQAWFAANRDSSKPMILVGDLNIAPHEHDVWSHKQLLKVVSHTPPEVERLLALQKNLDWTDTGRAFHAMDEKLYSWWSYRNRDWKKSNRGRRLDHIWITPPLKEKLNSYHTFTEMRDAVKPSDHVPIMADVMI